MTLDSLTDTLPAGFTYVPGSTTGATTANPTIAGQDLTWSGISVPGAGSASITFSVTASSTPGTYTNEATATAEGYTVAPTGATAPVTVTAAVEPARDRADAGQRDEPGRYGPHGDGDRDPTVSRRPASPRST